MISGYTKEKFRISTLKDKTRAFFDSENYYINDVPKNYENLYTLKSLKDWTDKKISLITSDNV